MNNPFKVGDIVTMSKSAVALSTLVTKYGFALAEVVAIADKYNCRIVELEHCSLGSPVWKDFTYKNGMLWSNDYLSLVLR